MMPDNSGFLKKFTLRTGEAFPKDWKVDDVEDCFDLQQGKALSRKNNKGVSPKPFLRTANVFWNQIDSTLLDEMDFNENEIKKLALQYNDVLVCEGGDVGRTAVWKAKGFLCFHQNHVHRLRYKNGKIEPNFFGFWMEAAFKLFSFYSGSSNKTTIANLSGARLKAFQFPRPSLPEQRAIAKVLSTIQQAIAAQDKIIEHTHELKNALMLKLFTEGLNGEPQKQTEIGPIPKSWKVVPIDEVLTCGQYGLSVRGETEGEIPILRMNCQIDGRVYFSDLQYVNLTSEILNKFLLKKGDVLFNRTNSYELVGRTSIFDSGPKCVFASYLIRLQFKKDKMLPELFNYYFNMDETQVRLKRIATRGVSQSNISASKLKGFQIPLPPIKDQIKITQILNPISQKIDTNVSKKFILKDLFNSILSKLMTGQIRATNLI